ncbi:MAG: Uroporphyrinogen III decarboxylase, partial [uncultured Acidimicrobiales bacterium]
AGPCCAPVPRRLPPPADGPHAGVVHAPGRPVAPRVPGHPGRRQHPRRHQGPGPLDRDHAPAGAPLRGRRRHPLLRHRRARPRHRLRRGHRARGGTRRRGALRARGRPGPPPAARAGGGHALGARDRAPAGRRAAGGGAAHRLRRGPLHRGQLPHRGSAVPDLREDEGDDARRARPVLEAARRDRHALAGVTAVAGGGGSPGLPALRQLGGGPERLRLPHARAPRQPADLRRHGRPGRPRHPLRRRHRRAAHVHGGRRSGCGRGGLAGPARRSEVAPRRPGRRPGQPRPGGRLRPVAGPRGQGPRGPRREPGPPRSCLQPRPRGAAGDRPRPADPGRGDRAGRRALRGRRRCGSERL